MQAKKQKRDRSRSLDMQARVSARKNVRNRRSELNTKELMEVLFRG